MNYGLVLKLVDFTFVFKVVSRIFRTFNFSPSELVTTLIQFSATVSTTMRGGRSDSRIVVLFHSISSALFISMRCAIFR